MTPSENCEQPQHLTIRSVVGQANSVGNQTSNGKRSTNHLYKRIISAASLRVWEHHSITRPNGNLVWRLPDYWREDKMVLYLPEPSTRIVPKHAIILREHPNQDIIPDAQTGATTNDKNIGLSKAPLNLPTGGLEWSHTIKSPRRLAEIVEWTRHRTTHITWRVHTKVARIVPSSSCQKLRGSRPTEFSKYSW